MLLLGIDVGTSSIKVSVVDAATQQCIVSAQYPDEEAAIISLQSGWAEQSPDVWWQYVKQAIQNANNSNKYNPKDIAAIGIAYQMHGLVVVNKQQQVIRNSIIWCDSRAVEVGNEAYEAIGAGICNTCLLNSPGNFTASKLGWVKKNEPQVYGQVDKMMLPGDFIAMKLTGEITTSSSALSEGVLWDFSKDELSQQVMNYFGFNNELIPVIQPLFSTHGTVQQSVADELGLKAGIPVSYKAGDQPNNALSLNVLQPGEVAATAGTSGVIYAVTNTLLADKYSRVNTFAHVNHTTDEKRLGVLLCINGTGIANKWIKMVAGENIGYSEMNKQAAQVAPGSDSLMMLPFGNGAERMLQNQQIGARISNIDFNRHTKAHLYRAAQEGIAFAFRYGLDIMRENGLEPSVIRAGKANMFLSEVFTKAFVNVTNVPVELYSNDGSVGAALGAGIGANIYTTYCEAFLNLKPLQRVEPDNAAQYNQLYMQWKEWLMQLVK
ncbi:carbohydrate kinase [Ilyomonas limi]|uniref:Carbohydrate kinase n=1 Tax=Ilyomonas limi TaxID=2575867 RepID=A0A4V5UV73_9BACT|nr:FGGY family carbohydrate kinase [Ilyomonas limi]TKK71913.1 carbohydrate kinase [Ilyomonas limi]